VSVAYTSDQDQRLQKETINGTKANSADPDQTAPIRAAVWSGFALFVNTSIYMIIKLPDKTITQIIKDELVLLHGYFL